MRKKFLKYLTSTGISFMSLKYYSSDFAHFELWMKKTNIQINQLNIEHADAYKNFLQELSFSKKTINRKLSTVRRFSEFLYKTCVLDRDFAQHVINLPSRSRSKILKSDSLIAEFKKHLDSKHASKSTIKNYISDVKHFISWLDSENILS